MAGALVMLGAAALWAHASPPAIQLPAQPHARVELVADASSIAAGKPFTVALHFKLDPEWHVYFKDPGGIPLSPGSLK